MEFSEKAEALRFFLLFQEDTTIDPLIFDSLKSVLYSYSKCARNFDLPL